MINKKIVYIQVTDSDRMPYTVDAFKLYDYLTRERSDITVHLISTTELVKSPPVLSKNCMFIGGLTPTIGLLKRQNICPVYINIPAKVQPLLKRKYAEYEIGENTAAFQDFKRVFVKPTTYFDINKKPQCIDYADLSNYLIENRIRRFALSEVSLFFEEYRVFVENSNIIHISRYHPNTMGMIRSDLQNPDNIRDLRVLLNNAIEKIGKSLKAYTIDIGLGKNLLENRRFYAFDIIEINDGFCVGSYDLPAEDYFSFLETRWDSLFSS